MKDFAIEVILIRTSFWFWIRRILTRTNKQTKSKMRKNASSDEEPVISFVWIGMATNSPYKLCSTIFQCQYSDIFQSHICHRHGHFLYIYGAIFLEFRIIPPSLRRFIARFLQFKTLPFFFIFYLYRPLFRPSTLNFV